MLVHAFVPSSTSSTPVQSSTAAADSLLLSKISINQIPPNSPLFYIHSTFAWVFAFWAYYSLFRMWQEYSLFRGMWFSSDEFKNSWENRLVVMTDLPDTLLRQQALTNYLKLNGAHEKPNQVVFGRDVSSLSLLVQQVVILSILNLFPPQDAYTHSRFTLPPYKTPARKIYQNNGTCCTILFTFWQTYSSHSHRGCPLLWARRWPQSGHD